MEKNQEKKYSVLLYYCYTPIENPELFRDEHHQLCLDLNLLGRIIVAHEGLNGTVSGLIEDCERYMQIVKSDSRFASIDFKVDYVENHVFQKLHVRVKPEIVHSDLHHIMPGKHTTGKYVEPYEFKELKNRDDVVLLDVRSNYEHQLGKFKNAITLDIENFREFPQKIEELEKYKDKTIITYCTGGIKCEKASAYLIEKGFKNVYQLHGGIIKYGLETDGEDFEGECYVFDGRVHIPINRKNPTVISKCYVCGTPSSHYVNCANELCNRHTAICENCMEKMEGCCSEECRQSPKKRPWNMRGYYVKQSNGYNPRRFSKRYKPLLSEKSV
ncbi:MAG: rhodanese-related sulfurtransferase [Cytophagales bacterium]|nr:rhodanese-related sulfurtransferase [Cytophagales bacterium]MDW8383180.1 rhodanese-related sulfurtransferase [Flammeovirgaceae bacterium]